MKYIVVLGDGMADYKISELGDKTPLEAAKKPTIDFMCQNGITGIVKTVPDDMPPGSDVANLSILGYDPKKYYTGRSPLEAMSVGVPMKNTDICFRANLVTLSDESEYEKKTMLDYSADEISTPEAGELISFLAKKLNDETLNLYSGFSYRHILLYKGKTNTYTLTPPHDISGKVIKDYLPHGDGAEVLIDLMKKSHALLKDHPVNIKRIQNGLRPANSLWFWGCGTKPLLDSFYDKFSKHAVMISAVDLLKGIGKCSKMKVVEVPGATGNIHTNFEGKAKAAVEALKDGANFVFVHIEAPDECGHRREIQNKVRSIELIDEKIVSYIKNELAKDNISYKMLITPDHATPISLGTHTHDTVPFVIFDSKKEKVGENSYTEDNAKKSGLFFENGPALMEYFLR